MFTFGAEGRLTLTDHYMKHLKPSYGSDMNNFVLTVVTKTLLLTVFSPHISHPASQHYTVLTVTPMGIRNECFSVKM